MNRLKKRFRLGAFLWIALVWFFLMGEFSWLNLLAAVVVGFLIVVLLPLPPMPLEHVAFRPAQILSLLWFWITGLISGSISVAWLAMRPAAPPPTGLIVVPMRLETELAMFVGLVLYNLQPGGTVTDVDLSNRRWVIHLIDAQTPEKVEQERQKVADLEKRLIATFEGGSGPRSADTGRPAKQDTDMSRPAKHKPNTFPQAKENTDINRPAKQDTDMSRPAKQRKGD